MKDWYKLKMSGEGHAKLSIFGDIGEDWYGEGNTGKKISAELAEINAANITVELDSYGGAVSDGIHIYNALKRHAAKITVDVLGVAVSAGSLIAMAGDEVRMGSTTTLMIHAPWSFTGGNAKEMREFADMLDTYAEAMANAYANKSGMEYDDALALLTDGEDHWYTAEQAQAAGFADDIYDSMPIAAHGAGFKRFKLPAAAAAFLKPSNVEENSMTEKTKNKAAEPEVQAAATPASAAPVAVVAPAVPDARAVEMARRDDINFVFDLVAEKPGMSELKTQCLLDTATTEAKAREMILAKIGESNAPIAGASAVRAEVVVDARDKFRAGAAESVLARFGVKGVSASGSEYRGMSLMDLARESLEMSGQSSRRMSADEIVKAAFTHTTSDFPVILENTMHKVLLNAYDTAPDTWSQFCAIGSVSDFREWKRIQTGTIGNLDGKNEAGEYKYKSLSDGQAEGVTASTVGNLVSITREMIVNDDMGAFLGITSSLGRAAARTIEAAVYAKLVANAAMTDGKAVFHADHGNLAGTAAGIGVSSLDVARVAMAKQMDISGNDFLDIRPSILLCPIGMGALARTTVEAQYDPETANKLQKPNAVNGIVQNIIDTPRLAGTGWYMLADPNDVPTIEVVFLNGERNPLLDQETSFKSDGVTYKVRHDFGVAAVDYRGAYFNAGA